MNNGVKIYILIIVFLNMFINIYCQSILPLSTKLIGSYPIGLNKDDYFQDKPLFYKSGNKLYIGGSTKVSDDTLYINEYDVLTHQIKKIELEYENWNKDFSNPVMRGFAINNELVVMLFESRMVIYRRKEKTKKIIYNRNTSQYTHIKDSYIINIGYNYSPSNPLQPNLILKKYDTAGKLILIKEIYKSGMQFAYMYPNQYVSFSDKYILIGDPILHKVSFYNYNFEPVFIYKNNDVFDSPKAMKEFKQLEKDHRKKTKFKLIKISSLRFNYGLLNYVNALNDSVFIIGYPKKVEDDSGASVVNNYFYKVRINFTKPTPSFTISAEYCDSSVYIKETTPFLLTFPSPVEFMDGRIFTVNEYILNNDKIRSFDDLIKFQA